MRSEHMHPVPCPVEFLNHKCAEEATPSQMKPLLCIVHVSSGRQVASL